MPVKRMILDLFEGLDVEVLVFVGEVEVVVFELEVGGFVMMAIADISRVQQMDETSCQVVKGLLYQASDLD